LPIGCQECEGCISEDWRWDIDRLQISPKNLFGALPRRLWLLLGFFLHASTDTIGSPYI
jgi:hypothetical protein